MDVVPGRASQQALLYSYFKAGNPASKRQQFDPMVDGHSCQPCFFVARRRFRPLLVLIIRQCLQALDLDSRFSSSVPMHFGGFWQCTSGNMANSLPSGWQDAVINAGSCWVFKMRTLLWCTIQLQLLTFYEMDEIYIWIILYSPETVDF